MSNPARTCRWVTMPATAMLPASYCDRPVPYQMVEDGGEPGAARVRQYGSFCKGHEKMAQERARLAALEND